MLLRTAGVGAVVLVLACGGGAAPDGYGAQVRDDFVEACTVAGTSRDTCACLYRRLAAEVPFARFEELDRRLRDGDTTVPQDIQALAVACAADPRSGTTGDG